ncbi:hypothetical protein APHAL10511_008624 [Amanita phalloides]|nr:hypothetical protein APHAL10511_008624 [Amanita phalloides]
MTQRTDALVVAVLLSAHCETDARSFKDLQRDLNALAVWNDKKTIRRRIYRTWPRSPKGEDIHPENSCFGKRTSNKIQLWGSTIWDFFWVNRMPSVERLITISTGSKLSKWMIQHNETEHALFELEWAKEESDPRQIFPYPIVGVIEDQEMRIRLGICGKSMLNAAKEQDGDDKSGSGRDEGVDDEQWESESEDDGGDWDERLGSGDERLGSGDESDDQDDDSHVEEDEEDEESSMDVDQPVR